MTQQTTQKTIQKITRKIVKGFHPQKIILFGSRGWGKPHADSDIDFFIVKESKQRRIDRERTVRSLLFGSRFPSMDLLVYTPPEIEKRIALDDVFIRTILERGKVIYEW